MYYLIAILPLDVTLAYCQGFDSPAAADIWRKNKPEYMAFEIVDDTTLSNLGDVIEIPIKRKRQQ